MNIKETLIILTLSLTLASHAEQEATDYQNYEQTNDQNDQLEKLLEIPEVSAIYDKCQELKQTQQDIEISTCLWNGNGEIIGVSSSEEIKKKITDKLSNLDQSKKQKKYESVNVVSLSKETTESQKKLEEYYYKTMKETIFGDTVGEKNKDGTYSIIDHSKFNTIYQNQLTKNILTAISSFCIEADVVGSGENAFPLLDKEATNRNKTREENIKTLAVETVGEISGAQSQSSQWQTCFINAQYVCHGGTKKWKKEDGTVVSITAEKAFEITCDKSKLTNKEYDACKKKKTKRDENVAYTKTRACELTNYLKTAKQNLKAVEKISEGYKKLSKTGGIQVVATGEKLNPNENLIKSINIDDKVDEITSVTSNQFVNESGFSEGVNKDLADLEACIVKDPNTGDYSFAPGAAEECKKYLNTDREEVEQIKSEYALRLRGLAEKVKAIDSEDDDTKSVEVFLQDQGYTDDEIGQTIEVNTDIKKLKEQIISRYENEKEELIKAMNERMESKASTKDGEIDLVSVGSDSDMDKLIKIHEELSSKTEQYAQLIHFNNVVSGFLDIDQKGKETRKNTASIQREIANSAFSEDNLGKNTNFAGDYKNQAEGLEEALKANNIQLSDGKDTKPNEEGATLGVDKINNVILNYDVDSQD